jgi:hypothetical protein
LSANENLTISFIEHSVNPFIMPGGLRKEPVFWVLVAACLSEENTGAGAAHFFNSEEKVET